MKKIGAIVCLTMLMVMITATFCFGAETFKVDSTYPKTGKTNTTKDNMCVKVYFNKAVGNKSSKAANKNAYKITNSSGKEFPARIYYSPKNDKYALILLDTVKVPTKGSNAIKDNTWYACTISADFTANDGEKLGTEQVIKFKTMNQARNTSIYMIMMVLMFGGMFWFSAKQMKKQGTGDDNKDGTKGARSEAFNPYKESKRTGKPVEEIIAQHEKEEAKRKAREKHKKEADKAYDDMFAESENYRVSRPKPISAAGCTYKTGRKAIAEAKAKKAAEEKAKRKANGYGKAKSKKKK